MEGQTNDHVPVKFLCCQHMNSDTQGHIGMFCLSAYNTFICWPVETGDTSSLELLYIQRYTFVRKKVRKIAHLEVTWQVRIKVINWLSLNL